MKNNLWLVGILSALLVGTYFFQEKRVEREYKESEERDLLIQQEIKHIRFADFEAEKRDGQWWSGTELLSHNNFSQLEKKLKELKKLKDIEGEWGTFFVRPVNFEVNHEPWSIGMASLDNQSFYVGHGKKIYLAFIDGGSHELVDDENKVAETKFKELKSMLVASLESYREKQFFRFIPKLSFERAFMKAPGALAYELDFVKNVTVPKPIEGIEVHEDLKGKFLSLITQMMIQKEIPYTEKAYAKKMGEAQLIDSEGKTRTWELWQENEKNANAILVDRLDKKAFLAVGGTMKIFFTHYQDFWDKKVIPPSEFKSFSHLDTYFSQGKKDAHVKVMNKEPLEFETTKYKVQNPNMQELFAMVFNLAHFDQADRVSPLSPSERQQVLNEELLHLQVFGQELVFWQKAQELIVVNLTQKLKAHFGVYQEKFRARFESVLE